MNGGDDAKQSIMLPVACGLLISTIYFVFLLDNLVPQLQNVSLAYSTRPVVYDPRVVEATQSDVLITFVVFHSIFFLFVVSILRASLTPAGGVDKEKWRLPFPSDPSQEDWLNGKIRDHNVPLTEEDKQIIKAIPIVERKGANCLLRKCEKGCHIYKPDRCHHCRVCKQCVLRMDHHCPWIANCVGFANYKFFLLMLFYGILSIIFVLGASLERFLRIFEPTELSWTALLQNSLAICIVYFVSIFVFVALVVFFSFHLYLVLNSLTTIEMKEKKNSQKQEISHRFQISHAKVDKGPYQNFVHIFGPWYMWLIPIAPPSQDDGSYTKGLPKCPAVFNPVQSKDSTV